MTDSRVRVFIACSLDGFIAGPDDDLSWLPGAEGNDDEDGIEDSGYGGFIRQVGALLMGRRTHDVVASFDGRWPYGERPVLVATHRPLESKSDTVRAVSGDIGSLVSQAKEAAGDADVYLDGGGMIRQGLDAGLVDELTVTVVPIVLGRGVPLFAGSARRHELRLVEHRALSDDMMQLRYQPKDG